MPKEITLPNSFEATEPVAVKEVKYYKMQSVTVDAKNVKRTRVLLTPSMCKKGHCTFDVATANGFEKGWEEVPEENRPAIVQALAKHVEVAHSTAEEVIIAEADLPKSWLSNKSQF